MPGLNSIEGLASNLNTTEIINATLEFERQPAVLMEQRQAEITKEISTFNALSAKLLALQTSLKALNSRTKLSQASIDISDENLLSATATGVVGSGTYYLNILSLARNHQIASQGFDDSTQAVFGTGSITLSLGDQSATTINIAQGENSLVGIKNAINDARIGITAAIVNDGTGSQPYRLVLTGNKTGAANKISVTSSLSGGLDLDFESAVFDNPEELDFSVQATSVISLGATASYSGSTNKTYLFAIAGSGVQTVGDGNITINWVDAADPSNSGSIVVDQADKIIEGGPEGLTLSFSNGDLVAGDTFQVSSFAPLLQQASDARISIGSSDGGASPIIVSSETNTFKDVIPGLELVVKNKTDTSSPVAIKTGLNVDGVKQSLQTFIDAYNDVVTFINEQNKYDADSGEAGILLGDLTLMTIQSRLQGMISRSVSGLGSAINSLASIGIRTGADGKLSIADSTRLESALKNDFDSILKLFIDNGTSSSSGISFLSAASKIKGGTTFNVNITQAATHGYLKGTSLSDLAGTGLELTTGNNRIRLRVDGMVSDEIVLSPRVYYDGTDLARELQTRIDADKKIGNRGISVTWVDEGSGAGHLVLTGSSYGSTSKIEIIASQGNNAYSKLGLATATVHVGEDVAGTINGEKATGKGQILTGNEGNATTDSLKFQITLDSSQVGDGVEGSVVFTKGISSILGDGLDSITKSSEGVIARKTGGLQKEVENIKQQIADFDERLELRRQRLLQMWIDLETVLSQLQSQNEFLTSQLQQISANTSYMLGNIRR